jgi:hypothetical protein
MLAELTFDSDPILFILALLAIAVAIIWLFKARR